MSKEKPMDDFDPNATIAESTADELVAAFLSRCEAMLIVACVKNIDGGDTCDIKTWRFGNRVTVVGLGVLAHKVGLTAFDTNSQ